MKTLKRTIITLFSALTLLLAWNATADSTTNSVVGAGGYDLVSYHTGKKPLPGNGNFVATVDQVNYIFSSLDNLNTFKKNKKKYLPQYGGFCAFGASVGKKFIGDPNVWEVVDGKLYFNLDNSIKTMWVKDIPGNLKKANEYWKEIKTIPAGEL